MSHINSNIEAVPTNIITGFLGVGKTSAIIHLLSNKPKNERWAILVNEFGEIGVDGSLFEGQHSKDQGVFIREVPGGCMCCASGLPMQIALNQLLALAKPDRLLIEPTGLGHPKEVLEVLSSDHYKDVLSLQKTLTLVDARKLSDKRYSTHDTFIQQIALADVVVGNKLDLYENEEKNRLTDFVKQHGQSQAKVTFTQHGKIALSQLKGATATLFSKSHHHHYNNEKKPTISESPIPKCGFIKATNEGDGFKSVGWRFSPEKIFNRQKLLTFLTGIQAERMKAVFITNAGIFGYNLTEDALTEVELDDCFESRIEIISDSLDGSLETQLMDCVAN
ncbi:CobW family GTP-binding protein [Aliikangiella coralliicola]|uniref:GTP-binding protein n=1 Tax=Aliikangiella coralliicola TaxID=2592383 RepID=A0A545UGN6_9GAMM|nr:GTP-binding protein [Aliikangiella coralliicola]TQV88563.1 GTP-binding protein [Aliikangiella coralliicola]